MGIQGLLPFLDKVSKPVNISEFNGAAVAVDAYCWLHKGAFSCAEKLARDEKCDAYVHYCMKYVNMLLKHNIKPILVFDGRHLPAKAETEKKRRENRLTNRKKAAQLLREGKHNEAKMFIRRCVDITHSMAVEVMDACRAQNVDCITAPFEADAQLAFLNITGYADIVITEDSDLLLFGCTKVIFKMDLDGHGMMITKEDLYLPMKIRPDQYSFDKFRRMCILSGCDYLKSLPGIGLTKACRFISRTSDPDIHRALSRLGLHLNMNLAVPKEYRDEFLHAEAMFQHQPVFDPRQKSVVHLTPVTSDTPHLNLPPPLDADDAYQLALGNVDPFTLQRVSNWRPDDTQNNKLHDNLGGKKWCKRLSIWSADYNIEKYDFSQRKPQHPKPTTGISKVKDTDSLSSPTAHFVSDDADIEMMLFEDEQHSPPTKRKCTEHDSGVTELDTSDVSKGSQSPVLSHRNNKFVGKFRRRNEPTVISDGDKVFSRYFSNSRNSSDEVNSNDNSPSIIDNDDDNKESKADVGDKLKDLSNTLDVNRKLSPKINSLKDDDVENDFRNVGDSLTDVRDCEKSSGGESSQHSLGSQPESDSHSTKKNLSSLFKWKTKFHEKFGFGNSMKLHCSKIVNNDFQCPRKEICDRDNDIVNVCDNINDSKLSCSPNSSTQEQDDSQIQVVDEGIENDVTESLNATEKKTKINPFKIRSAERKCSTSFNILHDPVPNIISQEMDESFVISPPSVNRSKSLSLPSKSNSKSANKSKTSVKKQRNVGLSKKSTPGKPVQKSLLSMFLLQPKPKLQC